MNCFSGSTTSVLKALHCFFLILHSKNEKNNNLHFQFHSIIIGKDDVVSLGRCGPLKLMLGSLFILNTISCIRLYVFQLCLLFIKPQKCKFYASMMKSNLLNVQRLSLLSFEA